jgi:uncharacterized protein
MELTLVLTHACNLACRYCYAGPKSSRRMSEALGEQALAWGFAQVPPGGKIQVGYFGGEPLLTWDLLRHFQVRAEQLAREKNITLVATVTTNGTLLTDERMAWLAEHGVVVAVSLDGARETHEALRPYASGASSFEDALRGAKVALARAPLTELIAVSDPGNVARLSGTARFLLDQGARVISLSPNYAGAWEEAALETYAREFEGVGDEFLRRFRAGEDVYIAQLDAKIVGRLKCGLQACDKCTFGLGEVAVAPSGNLYPCERLVGEDSDPRWVIGTLERGVDRARLEALYYARLGKDFTCVSCALRPRCMNFCGCSNAFSSGDAAAPGAFLCRAEQVHAKVADRVARTLFWEANPVFLRKFYQETAVPSGVAPVVEVEPLATPVPATG